MIDKYSKLEERIKEEVRRRDCIGACLRSVFEVFSRDDLAAFLDWKIIQVKSNDKGERVNVVEIVCKNSTNRFVFNQNQEKIIKEFEGGFRDNLDKVEKIVFRVR